MRRECVVLFVVLLSGCDVFAGRDYRLHKIEVVAEANDDGCKVTAESGRTEKGREGSATRHHVDDDD